MVKTTSTVPNFMLQIALACLLSLTIGAASAAPLDGRVFRIDSGDSITVLDSGNRQHSIRLAGIAAPDRLQAYGSRSQASLGALLSGREVNVIGNSRERDGTLVGKVLIAAAACRAQPDCPMTLDAGLQQVADGMAWWHPSATQSAADRASYQQAEFDAKIRRRGLWADTNPTPPWQWRAR